MTVRPRRLLAFACAVSLGCTAVSGADDLRVETCSDEPCDEVSSETAGTLPPAQKQPKSGTTPAEAGPPRAPAPNDAGGDAASDSAPGPTVSCGGIACPASKPQCCVDSAGGAPPVCVAEGEACPRVRLRCDDSDDCAGGACCLDGPASQCRPAAGCIGPPRFVLCASHADCPGLSTCVGTVVIGNLAYKACS